jgi:hypothetical protein
MPRLRDTRTGVVVSVDDATGASLGAAYEPVVDGPFGNAPKKAPAKKAASSKSDDK